MPVNCHTVLAFLLHLFIFCGVPVVFAQTDNAHEKVLVDVGLILNVNTRIGKRSLTSINMAIEDFYSSHSDYKTRIVLHLRDSKADVIGAGAAAVDLIKNVQVKTIIGPTSSTMAHFVINLASKTFVPVVSFAATSPALCPLHYPYFIRTALNDSSQVFAIASIFQHFTWREAVLIYDDSCSGTGIVPELINALQSNDIRITHRIIFTSDYLYSDLKELKNLETRVYVVHTMPDHAVKLFQMATELGMMSDGYVWIVTYWTANALDNILINYTSSMNGVIGVRPKVERTPTIEHFCARFMERFQRENPKDEPKGPSLYQLWAYDTVYLIGMAVERVVSGINADFQRLQVFDGSTDLKQLGILQSGPELLHEIKSTRFMGLLGEFKLVSGQLQSSVFEIVNVDGNTVNIVGFWTPDRGITRILKSNSRKGLKRVSWPGNSQMVPRGWEIPTNGKKLRIGVPVKHGFKQFVNVETINNVTTVTGYCIDMFEAAIKLLPFSVSFEYIPYSHSFLSYNDLVYQVYLKNFDVVVGDTTIIANRSNYVDYTMPYTDSGVSMVVKMKQKHMNRAWIFLKPWTLDLWLGTLAFFVFTAFVLWLIEHTNNLSDSQIDQLCTSFYFVFSALVFAHKEDIRKNLSRFVVVIWVFVVLILTTSYTASLSSMLTVQQLQPTVTDVKQLLSTRAHIGFQSGSFVKGMLTQMGFREHQLKDYNTSYEYAEALLKGSRKGGVDAIFDEIPYLKIFLADHCSEFTMVGPTYKTDGFGFVFPRDSPLVPEISRAILNLTEVDKIKHIETEWFGNPENCPGPSNNSPYIRLSLESFKGLFFVTGVASIFAFLIFLLRYCYNEWHPLKIAVSREPSLSRKVIAIYKHYHDTMPTTPNRGLHVDVQSDHVSGTLTNSASPQSTTSILDQSQFESPGRWSSFEESSTR